MWFVALLEGRLSMELAMAEDGLWWHNGMIGNRSELRRGCFGMFVVGIVRVRWGVLLVVWSPLHRVVDFPGH
jgi:hypothetical protein